MQTIKGIRYYSFGGHSGYGLAAQSYMLGLHAAGIPIDWRPLLWRGKEYVPLPAEGLNEWLANEKTITPMLRSFLHSNCDYSHVVAHVVPEYWKHIVDSNKTNIGYTTWEADELPKHWPDCLNTMDAVAVPSTFNQDVFCRSIATPVAIVPHIIDPPACATSKQVAAFRGKYNIPNNRRIFYSINTWTVRKNIGALLNAFALAFDQGDDVCLVIKTSKAGVFSPLSTKYELIETIISKQLTVLNRKINLIVISDDDLADHEIAALHEIGDIYVSLTYGEGWGMGAADAVSLAKPVIMTGWGGHVDFLPTSSRGSLKYTLVPPVDRLGSTSYMHHQRWARPSIEHAIEKLRDAHANFEQWQKEAKEIKLNKFNSESVTKKFINIIAHAKKQS